MIIYQIYSKYLILLKVILLIVGMTFIGYCLNKSTRSIPSNRNQSIKYAAPIIKSERMVENVSSKDTLKK